MPRAAAQPRHPLGSPLPSNEWPATAEWLATDGAGGYGCGTVADLATRRYHGLWIAREAAGQRRHMVVAGLDERVATASNVAPVSLLHAHWADLPEAVPPQALVDFAPHPHPSWTFRGADFVLRRCVVLRRVDAGAPCLAVRWQNLGRAPLRLTVRPLLGCDDVDHLPPADEAIDRTVEARGASWGCRPNPRMPWLWLSVDGVAAFVADGAWYRNFLYAIDRERGYDHRGDRWSPGMLELDLAPGAEAWAVWTLGEPCPAPAAVGERALAAAARRWQVAADDAEPLRGRLAFGADDFLYRAVGNRPGVLAGFPWFGEWGRDVFLALPGLTLARGRVAECAAVLDGALPFLRRGLLPNIYGRDQADSHYGSCDAALWYSLAVQRYAEVPGADLDAVRQRYVPALRAIVDAYLEGTDLGLAVLGDGLLLAGRVDLNATWMDAQTSRGPVTPRAGQPVELQALWYALLAFLVEHGHTDLREPCERAGAAFVRRFWLEDPGCLADCVRGEVVDRSVRPNMVLAAALARSPLSQAQRQGVVAVAATELLTPRGLRTLSPRDPRYRPRYEGGTDQRDGAYHQGTVWPWLLGGYVEASLRAAGLLSPATRTAKPAKGAKSAAAEKGAKDARAVIAPLRALLADFAAELDRAGIDHVSEVFDGELPQRPSGTFAQAWNTGELLRALRLLEDGERA